jgi:hypothetical protein
MIWMKIFHASARRAAAPGMLFGPDRARVASRTRHVEIRHRLSGTGVYHSATVSGGIRQAMAEVTIVYWRDIPAQVIVGTGRRASKVQLSERFEQAIDRCAMKVGARDTDSYLAEWRKAPAGSVEGEPDAVAAATAARLEAEFDAAALKRLIDSEGWAKA